MRWTICGTVVPKELHDRFEEALGCPWSFVFGRYGPPAVPYWGQNGRPCNIKRDRPLPTDPDDVWWSLVDLLARREGARQQCWWPRCTGGYEKFSPKDYGFVTIKTYKPFGWGIPLLMRVGIEEYLESAGVDLDSLGLPPIDRRFSYSWMLPKQLHAPIKVIATREGTTMEELKRQALDKFLTRLGY